MATPTGFPECNAVLNAPPGAETSCGNLPIIRFPYAFTGSVWELTPDELELVKKTGKIFVAVCAGGITQPPLYVCPYTPGIPQDVYEVMTQEEPPE